MAYEREAAGSRDVVAAAKFGSYIVIHSSADYDVYRSVLRIQGLQVLNIKESLAALYNAYDKNPFRALLTGSRFYVSGNGDDSSGTFEFDKTGELWEPQVGAEEKVLFLPGRNPPMLSVLSDQLEGNENVRFVVDYDHDGNMGDVATVIVGKTDNPIERMKRDMSLLRLRRASR